GRDHQQEGVRGRGRVAAGGEDLPRARRSLVRAGARDPGPLPRRRARRGLLALEYTRAPRRCRGGGGLGEEQEDRARARGQEGARHPLLLPQRGLYSAVAGERLRDGLLVLLRRTPQGLRQPDHDVRQPGRGPRGRRAARGEAGLQVRAHAGRRRPLGLRARHEQRPLGRRRRLGQRQGRGRALPRPPERQGHLRHEVREPRPPGLRPAGEDAPAVLADAAGDLEARGRAHLAGPAARRGHRRLRRGRLRGQRELRARDPERRLARGLRRALRHARRRALPGLQEAARRRGHLPDAHAGAARREPRLAPRGRERPLAARRPGAQDEPGQRRARAPLRAEPQAGPRAGVPHPPLGEDALLRRPVRLL
ncbi:MAG: Spore photoproduct lyase, partial [uncultured Rubrobacteraceae bacterium]